jgi:hypothetical protein
LVEIELKLFLDVEKLQIHQPCALQLKSSFFKPPFPQQIFMKSPPPYTQRNQYSIPREIKERERELYTKLEIHNVPGWLSPVLVWDFAFLLVRLNKNPGMTHKVRVPFGQNALHSLWVHEGHEPKHPLLLVRYPHVLNWPKRTAPPLL